MKRVLLIVLDFLLIVVCLYFGILGMIFKDDYIKEENIPNNNENGNQGEVIKPDEPNNEEPPIYVPSKPQIPVVTTPKYDQKKPGLEQTLTYSKSNMDEMTLYEAFSLKQLKQELISYNGIKKLNDGEVAYVSINDITVFMWSDGYITNVTEEREAKKYNSPNGNTVSLAKINNHYVVTLNQNSKTTLFIYDLKFKKVLEKKVNAMATPTLYNNYVFYGVDACNKTRFDGSTGKVMVIYAFGTLSGNNSIEFNIDNNNGTC